MIGFRTVKPIRLAEINAITVKDNISSQKLLEKLGLKLKGTIKLPDDEKEILLYKIKRENWLQQQI